MGLRARLAMFFIAITVVPLVVAVLALRTQIDDQLRQRAAAELASVRDAAVSQLELRRERAADLALGLVAADLGPVLDRADPLVTANWLQRALGEAPSDRADLVVLLGPEGGLLAAVDGARQPAPAELGALARAVVISGEAPTGWIFEIRQVEGVPAGEQARLLGWIVVGIELRADLLDRLVSGDGAALMTADGMVLAALGEGGTPTAAMVPADRETTAGLLDGERVLVTSARLDPAARHYLVLWAPVSAGSPALGIALLVLGAAVVVATVLGLALASGIIAPVREAAAVARAVAGGDLTRSLEPRGGKELGDLAHSLNLMTADLAAHIAEVERSRDLLRQSLSRLGETLSSSLDLNRTLAVVVETAMDTFEVDRGALRLLTPERDAVYVKVGRGVGDDPPVLPVSEGIIGWVVRTGAAVRWPADQDGAPDPLDAELLGAQQLFVPLRGRGGVLGVLSLARDDLTSPFTPADLDALRTFAGQASGAIENVMLHQEAQRLSVTDQLTGLWNFRYFQLQVERELESSARFERPLSLLIVDLDHFKKVNDEHGHRACTQGGHPGGRAGDPVPARRPRPSPRRCCPSWTSRRSSTSSRRRCGPGLDDILLVTGRGKRALEDHFDQAVELERQLAATGKEDLLARRAGRQQPGAAALRPPGQAAGPRPRHRLRPLPRGGRAVRRPAGRRPDR
jgi:two-component system, cell cycle response regulator